MIPETYIVDKQGVILWQGDRRPGLDGSCSDRLPQRTDCDLTSPRPAVRIIRKVKRRIVTFEIIHEVQGVLPFPDPALRLGRAHHALDIHHAAHVQAEVAPVQLHLQVGQTLFGNPFRQDLRQAVLHPRAAPRGIQRIGGAKSTYPCLLRREAIIALMKEIAARDAKNRFGRLA